MVVLYEAVIAIAVHIRRILVGIAWSRGAERYLRELVGTECAPFPVGRFQLVEGHGRIHALQPRHGYGIFESQGQFARHCSGKQRRGEYYGSKEASHWSFSASAGLMFMATLAGKYIPHTIIITSTVTVVSAP